MARAQWDSNTIYKHWYLFVPRQSSVDPVFMLRKYYRYNYPEYEIWLVQDPVQSYDRNAGIIAMSRLWPWRESSKNQKLIRRYLVRYEISMVKRIKTTIFWNLILKINERRRRIQTLLAYRRSFQAWRDRSRIFIPAREGRSMELRDRLKWGKKAANKQKHEECVTLLKDAGKNENSKCCVIS